MKECIGQRATKTVRIHDPSSKARCCTCFGQCSREAVAGENDALQISPYPHCRKGACKCETPNPPKPRKPPKILIWGVLGGSQAGKLIPGHIESIHPVIEADHLPYAFRAQSPREAIRRKAKPTYDLAFAASQDRASNRPREVIPNEGEAHPPPPTRLMSGL
eukprot:6490273-Amphidinium_carterae.1